jgi:ribulose-phosphate 3-epimerase
MIQTPDLFLEDFKEAGASSITVHQEAVVHLNRTLTRVRELGLKAGVAINPSTPVSTLSEIIGIVDFVLIMSVNPGFGGQKFISNSIRRIKELAEVRDKFKLNFLIEIDGGISNNNILEISSAGCNVFVIGNSIFGKDNITAATVEFKNLLR